MLLPENLVTGDCLNHTRKSFLSADDSFPAFLEEITPEKKLENETYATSVLERMKDQLQSFPRLSFRRKSWRKKTLAYIQKILAEETILNIHQVLSPVSRQAFLSELTIFWQNVRQFAPELAPDGIGQAIRNYTVYMMFAEMHSLEHSFYFPAYGYSMLYPFTDNYIDSAEYTSSQKKAYNRLIHEKLEGKPVSPDSTYGKKTCELLSAAMLEHSSEDSQERKSCLSQLLLLMLDAQEQSLAQMQDTTEPATPATILTRDECLDISLYKGGISVLTDRYYVNLPVSDQDLKFYFGFGFFLQLADDLQDIGEDTRLLRSTLFTLNKDSASNEKLVNQLLHYVKQLFKDFSTEPVSAQNQSFRDFVCYSSCLLIIYSAAGSQDFFSAEYLARLESFCPVSFSFLEENRKKPLPSPELLRDGDSANLLSLLDELLS